MDFPFIKLYFCSNDFLLINYLYKKAPSSRTMGIFARKVLNRKTGIGSNGIICIDSGQSERIHMRVFSSYGKMQCIVNDALFCLSRYAFDSGLFVNNTLHVETSNGIRIIDAIDSNNFRVSLDSPKTEGGENELKEFADTEYNQAINVHGKTYSVTPLHIERDGMVLLSNEIPRIEMKTLAKDMPRLLSTERKPVPIFVRVMSREDITVFVWFQRPPIDYSSAAAIGGLAAMVNGFCERDIIVHKKNEEHYLQWSTVNNTVYFTGSPRYVFSGSYYMDDEELFL